MVDISNDSEYNLKENIAGFEVLTAVTMKSTVLWVVTTWISEKFQHFHFRGTYFLHLQGQRISQAKDQQKQEAC
jgi:hypothetical protein